MRIAYGRQLVQDGTGKAPELAKAFVGAASFILTYGDILVKPETYQQMVHRFQEGYFSGVITVTPGEDVTKGGLEFFRRTILPQAPGGETDRRATRRIARAPAGCSPERRSGTTRAFTFSGRRCSNSPPSWRNLRAANTN